MKRDDLADRYYTEMVYLYTQTATHLSTNSAVHGRESNSRPVDPSPTPCHYTTRSPEETEETVKEQINVDCVTENFISTRQDMTLNGR